MFAKAVVNLMKRGRLPVGVTFAGKSKDGGCIVLVECPYCGMECRIITKSDEDNIFRNIVCDDTVSCGRKIWCDIKIPKG